MNARFSSALYPGPSRRGARLAAAGWLLAAVVSASAQPLTPAAVKVAPTQLTRAEVLDVLVLPAELPGGHKLREVSGLAWDKVANHLVSVSDRGLLVRWMLDIDHSRLVSAWPAQARVLSSQHRINAESVEVIPAGTAGASSLARLLVMDEKRNHIWMTDSQGMPAGTLSLPSALQHAPGGEGMGVEAIAWHVTHGALAARQWPAPDDAAAGLHRVHAADGRSWALRATPGGRSSIKAMHLLDARRLLLLEKLGEGAHRQVLLREVDLLGCSATVPCSPPSVGIDRNRFQPQDNFEGLACMDADLCVIVNDDGNLPQRRTVLALLRLAREQRAAQP